MERSSGLLVCPISGTVRDDLRSIPQLDDNGDEDEEQAAQMEGDFGGECVRHVCAACIRLVCSHACVCTHVTRGLRAFALVCVRVCVYVCACCLMLLGCLR